MFDSTTRFLKEVYLIMKKRLLSLALALLLILGVMPMALADGETTDPAPTPTPTEHSHEGTDWQWVFDHTTATCTEPGKNYYKCSVSGCSKQNEEESLALGHDFKNGVCARENCGVREYVASASAVEVAVSATQDISVTYAKWDGTAATPDVTPNFEIKSGNDCFTLSENKVTGKKKGSGSVTVSFGESGIASIDVQVNVTDDFKVSCESVSVEVGDTGSLRASSTAPANTQVSYSFACSDITLTQSGSTATFRTNKITSDPVKVTVTASYTDAGGNTHEASTDAYISVYTSHEIEATVKSNVSQFDFADDNVFSSLKVDGSIKTASASLGYWMADGAYNDIDVTDAYMVGQSNIGTLTVGSYGSTTTASMGSIIMKLNGTAGSHAYYYELTVKVATGEYLVCGQGTIVLTTGEFDADIAYSTYFGQSVTLNENDFKTFFTKSGAKGSLDYVCFELSTDIPAFGDLYTTGVKSTQEKVTSRMDFHYDYNSKTDSGLDDYDLDTVTYVPSSLLTKASTETIPFTCYSTTSGFTVSGIMQIKVGQKANFTDVASGDYFYDAVNWAVSNGITKGTSDTTFSPNLTCTRAEVVTFLWRAAGEPQPTISTTKFTDLDKDDYYYDAVLWAVEKGITEGTSATTFSPRATVTRGQVVTFLWRALGKTSVSSVNPFTDVKTSDYFCDAVLWAVKNDVTKGMSATSFMPDDGCTRGQIVTFLYRAYN